MIFPAVFEVMSLTTLELSFIFTVVNSRLSGTGSIFKSHVRSLAVRFIVFGAVITDGLNIV